MLCKQEFIKRELRKYLTVNTTGFNDEERAHANIVNGAMAALIGEAWLEAQQIARNYIASGKPVFAKVENVQAVALDEPPEKLFAALKSLEEQRDSARHQHGITIFR